MVAITQVRHRHSEGCAYYDKKLAEGKTPKEALRALKRQISNAIFACLQADARRAAARRGPGRATGERLYHQRGRLAPREPALRASHSRALATTLRPWPVTRPAKPLDTKRHSFGALTVGRGLILISHQNWMICAPGCRRARGLQA